MANAIFWFNDKEIKSEWVSTQPQATGNTGARPPTPPPGPAHRSSLGSSGHQLPHGWGPHGADPAVALWGHAQPSRQRHAPEAP